MAAVGFATAGVIFIARDVDKFIRSFTRINSATARFNKNILSATKTWNNFERQLTTVGSAALTATTTAVITLTVALGALALSGISTAASFEDAFADVTKTVDAFVDRAATAEQGVIQLTEAGQEFRDALKELSFEIPVTFERLSEIAGLGGQLGIVNELAGDEAREALLSFTETVAGLAEATNLTQQKAATGLAQISNIYRTSIDDIGENIERLGATIVELGNTSATTESLILNFTQRIAGAGQTVGLTQAQVLGIGTAFASIGITAEAGSTAVNRALLIINEAVSNSTEKFVDNTAAIAATQEEISDLNADLVRLEAQIGEGEGFGLALIAQRDAWIEAGNAAEDFGRTLGDARREQLFQTQTAIQRLTQQLNTLKITQGQALTTEVFDELLRVVQSTQKGAEQTAESFRELFREDPAEAFSLFVEGLAEQGERAGEVLDEIGLGSVEATRAFLAIAGASDTVRERIEAATRAFEENSALTDEVSIRYATLRSNFQEFINVVRGVSETLFSPLIDPAIALVEWGKEVIQVFGEEIPALFRALGAKIMPEIEEIFAELFGPAIISAPEITTDEGFVLSGELIGVESPTVTKIKEGFESIQESIDSIDISGFSDAVIEIRDIIVPIYTGAMDLATEHSDVLTGALNGLIAILGGAILFSAFTKAAGAIAFLNTPLGVATAAAITLGIVWETNFLKIQEVTEKVVASVIDSWDNLIETLSALELPDLFEDDPILGGPEMIMPEGFVISGDLIGIETNLATDIRELGESVLFFVGSLTELVIGTSIEEVRAIITVIDGLFQIGEGLTADELPLAKTLAGIEQVIDGFVDGITAPLRTLSEVFGLEEFLGALDFEGLRDALKAGAQDLILGFIEGFTGVDIEGLDLSFTVLLDQIQELAQAINFSVLVEGISTLVSSLGTLVEAFEELLGLEPNESLLTFVGQLIGVLASIAVDQLIAFVDGLIGLVEVLTGLFTLDSDLIVQGFEDIGLALLDFIIAPIQNIGERLGFDFRTEMSELGARGAEGFQEGWDEGFVTLETGRGISEWVEGLSIMLTEGINDAIMGIQDIAAINLDLEDIIDLEQLDQDITDWLDEISASFTLWATQLGLDLIASIQGIWTDVDLGVPSAFGAAIALSDVPQQLKDLISGVWDDVDLGIPSFQDIVDKAKEVAETILDFFTGLFDSLTFELPDFDLGILEKLADLGLIDLDVEAPDTEGLGTDLAQGLVNEVEEAEQTWRDAWLDFLLSPIELGKEALGVESPSTLTQELGQDVIEGYALGLSDLTPIEEAMIGVNSTILAGFQSLNEALLLQTIPTVQETDRVFTALYSDTFSRVTSSLNDELIPAKLELTEVNLNDLIPSVDTLIEVEEQLADTFEDVADELDKLVKLKERARDRSKTLVKEIDKLAKAYLTLASAIGSAAEAGDGLTNPPAAPGGPEFQSGGSFIVPSSIGAEGLPITVHAGELVQIIPADIVPKLRDIPLELVPTSVETPRLSGASINNTISSQTTNNDTREFHLHVTEAPSTDVRDSFDLLETLS